MSSFWNLVRNDYLFGNKLFRKPAYLWIFVSLLLLLFFAWYTLTLQFGTLSAPLNLLKITPLFVIAFAGISVYLSNKEWRKQTVSWWLMLPFPRYYLLGAKALSAFLICFKILLVCFCITLAAGLESYWLRLELANNHLSLGNYIYEVSMNYAVYLLISPVIIVITITFVMLFKSRWKVYIPLISILASPLLSLFFADYDNIPGDYTVSFQLPEYISFDYLYPYLPLVFVVSLLLTAVLLIFSSFILEKKVQV